MIGKRVVPDAPVHGLVRVPRALGAEFPYGPVLAMSAVEEGDEVVDGVAVRALRVRLRGAGAARVSVGIKMTEKMRPKKNKTYVAMMWSVM